MCFIFANFLDHILILVLVLILILNYVLLFLLWGKL